MRLPMTAAFTALALGVPSALAIACAPAAVAAPAAKAVGTWSMVPQVKDADSDGFIDGDGGVPRSGSFARVPSTVMVGAGNHVAQPNERLIDGSLSWYLSDRGFPVRLDACSSTGKQFRWTARSGDTVTAATAWAPLTKGKCSPTVFLPEGRYSLVLEVRGSGRVDSSTLPATIVNHLVVALGDSYASGEGNPRNVDAWLDGAGAFTPYWDDTACHRSVHAGVAQAALRLEESSAKSSVTLVDVTCSGATVDAGILGPQKGAGQTSSQVDQARAIIGDRTIDFALLTIGGNDIGFTSILSTCALTNDCPVSKAVTAPLNRYPTVQDGVQALTGKLTSAYARINARLPMSPGGSVLPVMYPDITRATSGAPCSYLTLSQSDFGWARDTVLVPNPQPAYDYLTSSGASDSLPLPQGTLNGQIAATGSMLGWHPVQRAWSASGESTAGHGVCAQDPWVFGLTALSAMPDASFHPNPAGHAVLGKAIAGALELALR